MTSSRPRSSQSTVSPRRAPSAPLPIDDRPDDLDDLIQALRACAPDELRRAQRHHRRALKALTNGQYNALSDTTRRRLIGRLRADLTALNRALGSSSTDTSAPPPPAQPDDRNASSGFWGFLNQVW